MTKNEKKAGYSGGIDGGGHPPYLGDVVPLVPLFAFSYL
jgi:hypothetical protein